MKPRVEGDSSHIQIVMDNQKGLNQENRGNFGYDPSNFSSRILYSS